MNPYRRTFFVLATLTVSLFSSACRLQNLGAPVPTLAVVAASPTSASSEAPPTAAPPEPSPTAEPLPIDPPTVEPSPEPTAAPTAAPQLPELPTGIVYDLGEAIIVQSNFSEDSRFRNMPVRLNGVMAVPESTLPGAQGPYPVVLILHGSHPGCPEDETGVDRWPCAPEDERPNYSGFEYLVRELAARGYVALSININGENTFGFGEPVGGERLEQIVDLHLEALAEAAAGGDNGFGVELAGIADMRRLAFFGHSRGGEGANWLAIDAGFDSSLSFANRGYGPVAGLLLIAPPVAFVGANGANVPLAVILPACDGDVLSQEGQLFYEAVRLGENENAPATTVFLERANHNYFNTTLSDDLFGREGRPDCEPVLEPDVQQAFLVDYAADFLTTLFNPDPSARLAAAAVLGMGATSPAPAEIQGLPAHVTSMAAHPDRRPLLVPASEAELATNLAGGGVTAEGITTHFCKGGYYTPEEVPGSEPCQRVNTTIPGYPAMMVVSWSEPGGALRFGLPEGGRDLSRFTTLSVRAAVDPLSPLNEVGTTQRFSVQLIDGAGDTAAIQTQADEPALQFPAGWVAESDFFEGDLFTGRAPMTTIRVSLDEFAGVDLTNITEIALLFDHSSSGNLFMGDIELIRPPHLIGAYSTLLENADGANDSLRGVARFAGASLCTGAFIGPSDNPDAPAYLLTNGHCAQDWDANRVFIDTAAEGWSATFNYFVDSVEAQVNVPVARVAYSTMKGRDVAIVELDATVAELLEQGITPFAIAAAEPEGTYTMRVVVAPTSSVPQDIAFLRQERCLARGRADLFEFIWHFNDALPNACQDIYGGSSGSPVFAGDDPAIIGLINTTNVGGITPCALGSPCEVRAVEGTVWVADTSYATPVAGLAGCFDTTGLFDLTAEGCPLDDGRQLLISGYPPQAVRATVTTADGLETPVTWNATLEGDLPYYRYKIGRAGEADCRVDEIYSSVIARSVANFINEPLPPDEGSYLLCVVAGESGSVDEAWQPVAWATAARVEIDMTPPTLTPRLSIFPDEFGGFRFEPIFAPPELSDFVVKFGPEAETNCADREGYVQYRRFPFNIPAEQVPARICVIGSDVAGNEGMAADVVVGK